MSAECRMSCYFHKPDTLPDKARKQKCKVLKSRYPNFPQPSQKKPRRHLACSAQTVQFHACATTHRIEPSPSLDRNHSKGFADREPVFRRLNRGARSESCSISLNAEVFSSAFFIQSALASSAYHAARVRSLFCCERLTVLLDLISSLDELFVAGGEAGADEIGAVGSEGSAGNDSDFLRF